MLIAATWFTASSAWKSVLLAPRVIKIHKPKIGNKLYCDSSLQTRSPTASFISPLSEATCHTHKPPLWCRILILLVCTLRSSTNILFERKISRDFEKSTKELTFQTLPLRSSQSWSLDWSYIRHGFASQSSISRQQRKRQEATANLNSNEKTRQHAQQCMKTRREKVKSDLSAWRWQKESQLTKLSIGSEAEERHIT